MLGDNRWYAIPDDTVETWCLLLLETTVEDETSYVTGWQVGCGNAQQLTYFESLSTGSPRQESQALDALLTELRPLRHDSYILITPSRRTLRLLRTRLLVSEIEDVTLRGFSHFSIEELLEEYFEEPTDLVREWLGLKSLLDDSSQDQRVISKEYEASSHTPIRELWSIVTQLGPLVPRKALTGKAI